jgi:S-formylglutathione hydrolase FrmB
LALGCLLAVGLAEAPAHAASSPSDRPATCRAGVITVDVPTPADVHVADHRVDVLLPADYCASATRRRSYPVLYLLHGVGDTFSTWTANTDVAAYSRAYDVIIVMPDGGHGTNAGWYSDWLDGQYQYETYDTSILPTWIDSHFRARPHDVAIAGNSMGGFGALSYAARHPRAYRAAAAFSGADDMLYGAPACGEVFAEGSPYLGTPANGVWGPQATDGPVWAAHNPASLAGRLEGTAVYLASGTGTPGGSQGDDPSKGTDYVLENGIFQMNVSMARSLTLAGVPYKSDFYAGGYHGWPYWQADLHWALPQLAADLDAPPPVGAA